MVWVQAFPTGPTLISQSVNQFQANNLFLQTNINTDHYFNSGAPNEGHHRFSQYVNQGGDPVLAVDGEIYVKANANGFMEPFFRNTGTISQIPGFIQGVTVVPGAGNTDIVNFGGRPNPFYGFFIVADTANNNAQGCALVSWDGVNARTIQIVRNSTVSSIQQNGTFVQITTSGAMNARWMVLTLYP